MFTEKLNTNGRQTKRSHGAHKSSQSFSLPCSFGLILICKSKIKLRNNPKQLSAKSFRFSGFFFIRLQKILLLVHFTLESTSTFYPIVFFLFPKRISIELGCCYVEVKGANLKHFNFKCVKQILDRYLIYFC